MKFIRKQTPTKFIKKVTMHAQKRVFLPDLDGESESSSHSGLGIGPHIVMETIFESPVISSKGLLSEPFVHVLVQQLQRPESMALRDLRGLCWKQIHLPTSRCFYKLLSPQQPVDNEEEDCEENDERVFIQCNSRVESTRFFLSLLPIRGSHSLMCSALLII